ncbi:MAG: substrate-binding domain-containing protein [Angustibacter sp.]
MPTESATESNRSTRSRQQRARRNQQVRLFTAAALVAIVVIALSVWGIRGLGSLGSCSGPKVELNIAAAPALAPPMTEAAKDFSSSKESRVGANCLQVKVAAVESPDAVVDLARFGTEKQAPGFQVWIPDSNYWITLASRRPEVAPFMNPSSPLIASTPTVFAMARPQAETLGWPNRQPSIKSLTELASDPKGWEKLGHPSWGRLKLAWTDPRVDAPGLEALMGMYRASAGDQAANADLQEGLIELQGSLESVAVDQAAAQRPLINNAFTVDNAMSEAVVFPSTEQAVVEFNRSKPQIPLAAVYPAEGLAPAQIPYMDIFDPAGENPQARNSAAFLDYLIGEKGRKPLAEAGFRSLGATPKISDDNGAVISEPSFSPESMAISSIARALQYWTALQERGNVLIVVDVSGSMNEQVPGTSSTRIALARGAIAEALSAYSSSRVGNTSVGLWAFSRNLDGTKDYRELIPLSAPTDAGDLRTDLARAIAGLKAAGSTGLYDTTAAAFAEVRGQTRPGNNMIVILSDGKNDDAGSRTLEQVVAEIKKGQSSAKPVRIDTIGYGGEADTRALKAISSASGGRTFKAEGDEDLRVVLLTALSSSSSDLGG